MANTLEDHVRWAIYNYPTLHRHQNYEDSRLSVLDHLFLVIGNGYEWDVKQGVLVDAYDSRPKALADLPPNFFGRNLYEIIYFDRERWDVAKTRPDYYYLTDEGDLVYEADESDALKWIIRFERQRDDSWTSYPYPARAGRHGEEHSPYPLCQYSALVEMLDGKTHSPGERSQQLTPHPDWIKGALDVAHWALTYYQTPALYCENMYHPDVTIPQMERDERLWARGVEDMYDWRKNLDPGQTKEQYAQANWDHFHAEQLDYLQRFIAKFEGDTP